MRKSNPGKRMTSGKGWTLTKDKPNFKGTLLGMFNITRYRFALTASALVIAFSVFGPIAQAQGPAAPDPGSQQSPADNQDHGFMMGRDGMMGHGVMPHGMIGGGMMGHGRGGGTAPMMMRMIFSLMDADGDGKLSLQEFQAAHERIFKAIDTNKDGFVTLEEMQNFIRGASTTAPQ